MSALVVLTYNGKLLELALAHNTVRALRAIESLAKAETDSIAVQDYVELVMILFSAIGIVWFRWVSTKSIASVGQVAADLLADETIDVVQVLAASGRLPG